MFPKRAILRVGMLLRDSNIAQEVRTQLLNIEQRTSSEAKIVDIDNEKQLLERAVGAAFIKNNNGEFLTAMKELIDYSSRYATEAYKAIENENAELKDW